MMLSLHCKCFPFMFIFCFCLRLSGNEVSQHLPYPQVASVSYVSTTVGIKEIKRKTFVKRGKSFTISLRCIITKSSAVYILCSQLTLNQCAVIICCSNRDQINCSLMNVWVRESNQVSQLEIGCDWASAVSYVGSDGGYLTTLYSWCLPKSSK
jgi:hypothetical protein